MIWKDMSSWYFEPNKIPIRVLDSKKKDFEKATIFLFKANVKRPIFELPKIFTYLNSNWLNLNFGNNAQFLKAEQSLKTKQVYQNS